MNERTWKIGELARATGLTVRTLHHYDDLGLLKPSQRTSGGHRIYSEYDVGRLYRIAALRRIGLPLPEIAAQLEEANGDLPAAVRRHLDQLERELAAGERLRRMLQRLLEEPTAEDLIATIEVMTMHEKHYSQEQLAELGRRADALGEEGMAKAQRDWAELIAAVEAEYESGTDPQDPRVQELAQRWQALIEAFTGGDPGIRESLQRMYESEGSQAASRGMVRPELMDYVRRATS